jgi:hypothetical protein
MIEAILLLKLGEFLLNCTALHPRTLFRGVLSSNLKFSSDIVVEHFMTVLITLISENVVLLTDNQI